MTILRWIAVHLGQLLLRWGKPDDPDQPAPPNDADAAADDTIDQPDNPAEHDDSQVIPGRSPAEQVTTLISVGLIVLLVGAILYEGYAKGQADPATIDVTVREHAIEQRGGVFYIPFEVLNAGDQTVEEVAVSFELLDGETVVAEGETVIATLGEDERVTAVFVVSDDPTDLTIEAGVVAFQIAED